MFHDGFLKWSDTYNENLKKELLVPTLLLVVTLKLLVNLIDKIKSTDWQIWLLKLFGKDLDLSNKWIANTPKELSR